MPRKGLKDDCGYHGFDECCKYEGLCGEVYEKGVEDAVDELAYWVAEKLYSVPMDFEQRAEFIALMEIKINEMKKGE